MLQTIRDRAHGWFATIVFAILVVPFALWGINWYVRERGEIAVAEVNGTEIQMAEFERAYQDYRRNMQAMQADISKLEAALLKRHVLEQMIDDRLLRENTHKTGLRISDGTVAGAIQSFAPFQREGKFARSLYENRLRDMGLSPSGFEARMRDDMEAEQLHQGISDTNFVTSAAVDALERLKGQRRDVVFATVAAEPLKIEVQPSDTDIEAYHRANAARFTIPEAVRVAYLELAADDLTDEVTVDETALKEYYENHRADYETPEERSANHILVHVEKDAKPEEAEAARQKAEQYLAEAKAGKSFEEIATAHSDDVGSKAEGGKTGFFRRGVMAPAFEEAAFSMQPGELRGPIRTEFGWHVIRLNEIKPAVVKSFGEAHADVEKAYRQRKAEELFYERADQLSTLTYENADSLDPAAKALNLTVKESGFFPRSGGDELFANPKVVEAAFSPEVLNERLNSQPVEIAPTQTIVLRVAEHRPAALRPLKEVREEVRALVVAEMAKRKAEERGAALLERLRNGEPRDALAHDEQLAWTEKKGITRDDPDISRAIARTAFSLVPAKPEEVMYGGVSVGTGDYALVGVLKASDPDLTKIGDAERKLSREQLFTSYANNDWRDYLAALKAAARIETHPDRL
ncbi:MAG: SurA N-terminal domain-containing protein [Chromatiales bacterium]